jgi:hypothetical protein
MSTKIHIVCGLLLAACSSSHERSPSRDAAPIPAVRGERGTAELDLSRADHAELVVELAPDRPAERTLAVPSERGIVVGVTHLDGAIGKMTLTLRAHADDEIPISDDSMTCTEAGCHFSVELASANVERLIVVTVEASAAMSVRLEAATNADRP